MVPKVVFSFFINFAAILVLLLPQTADAQGLKIGFYSKTCPKAEAIVLQEMTQVIKVAPSLSGPLLRMHFHDCFVKGCDGSILLNSSKNTAEKDAPPNLSLRGYAVIDRVKAKLEKSCKGIVSCADILALVARDVVHLTNGPFWQVPTGRRDGNVSQASDALANLPPPTANISSLKASFSSKGLNTTDLVVLSGSHTIGTSHCTSFSNRLYNFTGKGDSDPALDNNYVAALKKKCKPNDATTLVQMDPGSSKSFDTGYFTQVSKRRGLFQSDSALLQDPQTKDYVLNKASTSFFKDFPVSIVKMGKIGVLTGNKGEIRKHCAIVN
ncbi:Class I peroxidase protein [Dioscorea alata]|uniref:Class I peroxidase protein n=1 Tax=Dioscorea alata TaxID=55571 RepID=A0ACB7VNI7_DIOAL|nr:Class I peroxidase protein [Dioscorea alata]